MVKAVIEENKANEGASKEGDSSNNVLDAGCDLQKDEETSVMKAATAIDGDDRTSSNTDEEKAAKDVSSSVASASAGEGYSTIVGGGDLKAKGEGTSLTAASITSEGDGRTAAAAAAATTSSRKQRRNANKRSKQKLKKKAQKEQRLQRFSNILNKLTTTRQFERCQSYAKWTEQLLANDRAKYVEVQLMFHRIASLEQQHSIYDTTTTEVPHPEMGAIRFFHAEPIIRMEMISSSLSSSSSSSAKQEAKDAICNQDYLKNLIEEGSGTDAIDSIVEVYERILPKLQAARYFIGNPMGAKANKKIKFPKPPTRPECEICCAKFPLFIHTMDCCGKIVCPECRFEIIRSQMEMANLHNSCDYEGPTCPFCRSLCNHFHEQLTERVAKYQDTEAMYQLALRQYNILSQVRDGRRDKENLIKGVGLVRTSAMLGRHPEALFLLGCFYKEGVPEANIEVDPLQEMYYMQLAAYEGGNPPAWEYLGVHEDKYEKGMYHFRVAAGYGYEKALQRVKDGYEKGYMTKQEFADTLREFHAVKQEPDAQARAAVINEIQGKSRFVKSPK